MLKRLSAERARFALAPARNVALVDGGFVATSSEPWLEVTPTPNFSAGAFFRIRYAVPFAADPVRPVLQLRRTGEEAREYCLPGPTEGSSEWIGRMPTKFETAWISPTCRLGPFRFELLELSLVEPSVIWRAVLAEPVRMAIQAWEWINGLDKEADQELQWAIGPTPLSSYREWKSKRCFPLAAASFSLVVGPAFTVILDREGASDAEVSASRQSIAAQSYRRWRLLIDDEALPGADWRKGAVNVANLVLRLKVGDRLHPEALALFAQRFVDEPQITACYADHVEQQADGTETPIFKPDWSPTLEAFRPYVGRGAAIRVDGTQEPVLTVDEIADRLGALPTQAVSHIRRTLLTLRRDDTMRPRAAPVCDEMSHHKVTIIIPTRDRADLLRRCLESILEHRADNDLEILVADNDSVEPETQELFQSLRARDPRFRTLATPGPFNFSSICNRAAAAASGDVLIFLNNDTVAVTPDWVHKLVSLAARPDVGAVGARLIFPNGLVQHVGVTVGMAGWSDHFGSRVTPDDPGWLGRNHAPHEVAAVTGACLAVEKAKFEAIGGFDAERLPVDLNDVDLCLRLGELGWRSICDCRVEFVHYEFGDPRPKSRIAQIRGGARLLPRALAQRHSRRSLLQSRLVLVCERAAAGVTPPRAALLGSPAPRPALPPDRAPCGYRRRARRRRSSSRGDPFTCSNSSAPRRPRAASK